MQITDPKPGQRVWAVSNGKALPFYFIKWHESTSWSHRSPVLSYDLEKSPGGCLHEYGRMYETELDIQRIWLKAAIERTLESIQKVQAIRDRIEELEKDACEPVQVES